MTEKIQANSGEAGEFTFLTNHAFVLIHITRNPQTTLREAARKTKLTERTVYKIVRDLESTGYIVKHRDGRRNSCSVNEDVVLGHRLFGSLTVAQLADALSSFAAPPQKR